MDIAENIINFSKKNQRFILYSSIILAAASFFDKILFAALIFIAFLCAIVFYFIKNKKVLCWLFLIAFLVHLSAVFFIYYFHFEPFGGAGDYIEYNLTAQKLSEKIRQGDFSLEGIELSHNLPVIIGYIYAFSYSNMLLGQIFNAWISAILVVFIYLIVVEMGGSEKQGFFTGLAANFYPSLLFFGSLLLKDALVVLLSLVSLFFILKLLKNFSLGKFLIFYFVLGSLIHFRIYVGYAALLVFLICWMLFSNLKLKKRAVYFIVMIPFLGFLPQIFAGQSYFATGFLSRYLNKETITYYRETVYAPPVSPQPNVPQPESPKPTNPQPTSPKPAAPQPANPQPVNPQPANPQPVNPEPPKFSSKGRGSSIIIKTGLENPFAFLKNTSLSFLHALLGPLPWQINRTKLFFVLLETIPWYFLLFFIAKSVIKNIKEKYKDFLPLIIFSVFVFGVLAVFITNFGIIARIRMPAVLVLLCLVPFGLKIKIPFLEKYFFNF